ncbi:BON domain-containing protein [Herbaspirillum rhizosphaerae]|uniref:BON domain-containing protein n=1 Tax=Herbaspirillum rhizosphaerae TaxID=346179 RepID=UPI00067DF64F|nr:BON domain-containing protein [Herbaspirillum rhizosphaerae]
MTMSKRFAAFFFALFMLALAACSSTPQQASTGQIIDDSVITTKVKAAIFEEPNLKSMQISVETYKGIVQLSGFVNSSAVSLKAAEVTRKVEGVKGVKNSLVVKQ